MSFLDGAGWDGRDWSPAGLRFLHGGREGGMEGVRIVDYPIERWVNLYRCGRVIL